MAKDSDILEILAVLENLASEFEYLEEEYNHKQMQDGWDADDPSEALAAAKATIAKFKKG